MKFKKIKGVLQYIYTSLNQWRLFNFRTRLGRVSPPPFNLQKYHTYATRR